MRAKLIEQAEAKRLRALGWPLRRIATELGVALSSVSVWVREVESDTGANAGDILYPPEPREAEIRRESVGRKQCGKCREELPISNFNRRGTGRQHWCRACFRAYFQARGTKHIDQSEAAKLKRRHAAYALVSGTLVGSSCADCGTRNPEVFEFDHVGKKVANVSKLAFASYSTRRIAQEIERCEVVCVNCHRRRTARRAQTWRIADRSLAKKHLTPGQRRNLIWLRDLLLRSNCADCGLDDFLVLEFDHVTEKTANVPELARDGASLERLQREIACCEIVCANCHRIRTRRRKREAEPRALPPLDPAA